MECSVKSGRSWLLPFSLRPSSRMLLLLACAALLLTLLYSLCGQQLPSAALPSVQQLPSAVLPSVQQLPSTVLPSVQQLPSIVLPSVQQLPSTVLPSVQQLPSIVLPSVQQLPSIVLPSVQQLPSTVLPSVQQLPRTVLPSTVLPSVQQLPSTVLPSVQQLPSTVLPSVQQLPSTVLPSVQQLPSFVLPSVQLPSAVLPSVQQLPSAAALTSREDEPVCPPTGRLLSASKGGRLGNIMFEYATLLGASHALHLRAWLLPEMADTLAPYFEALSTPVLPRGCHYNWTEMRVEELIRRPPDGEQDILINGYPTAVPVFHSLRQQVLREFTFRPDLRVRAQRRLAELARQMNLTSPTFIGVHVRRTDYDTWLAKYVSGHMIGADYLQRALSLMRRRHPRALFVVASDDLAWCQRELRGPDLVLAGDGVQTQPGADMALLAACNHTVVTHGTYGFWAAYLAGGEVVAPTGYGRRQTGVEANERRAHLNWTRLDAFSF